MCGIAGFISCMCNEATLYRMGEALLHRGPDDTGYFYEGNVGFVNKRLSIVDLQNGKQPAFNETCDIAVILNGEIFNHKALKKSLEKNGHIISNNSDTAVLPHLYEEYGAKMFELLSGQFAIAIYDKRDDKLVLARDRMGIIPLFFCFLNQEIIFASEIKAILESGRVRRLLCFEALYDMFTFWSPQHDRTFFDGIKSLLPGEFLTFKNEHFRREKFFTLRFDKPDPNIDFSTARDRVEELLLKAVEKRLMGDVKVSSYLSGGLDSSLIASIIANHFDSSVEAFSVGFEDSRFDEVAYQKQVCDALGIRHHRILFKNSDLVKLLPKIIWHTEVPLLRGGPAPLFRLSELVKNRGVKVVLSGEGSDEFFGGYDIFRESKIRSYLKRYPDSSFRKELLKKVNQFSDTRLESAQTGSLGYFYLHGRDDGLFDSHYTRWRQIGFFERFFSEGLKEKLNEIPLSYHISLGMDNNEEIKGLSPIQKSQLLEIDTFLSRYLLSSQGDRISMANSVEVRFPFLDEDLIAYTGSLDDRYKIKALNEKYILKKIAEKYLPLNLVNRKKFPYRSPVDARKVLSDPYMKHMMSDEVISKFNLFSPMKVKGFINTITSKEIMSERETMLFMGILTTHMLCSLFNIETVNEKMLAKKCINERI